MGVGKSNTLIRDAVDVRRLDRRLGVIATGVTPAEIVGQNENNIRSASSRMGFVCIANIEKEYGNLKCCDKSMF